MRQNKVLHIGFSNRILSKIGLDQSPPTLVKGLPITPRSWMKPPKVQIQVTGQIHPRSITSAIFSVPQSLSIDRSI